MSVVAYRTAAPFPSRFALLNAVWLRVGRPAYHGRPCEARSITPNWPWSN